MDKILGLISAAAILLAGCSHHAEAVSKGPASFCARAPVTDPKGGDTCELIGENGNDDVYGTADSASRGDTQAADRTVVMLNGDCTITEVQATYLACQPSDDKLMLAPLNGLTTPDDGRVLPGRSIYVHRVR